MSTEVIFIQGGGYDGYVADQILVNSLQESLGSGFNITYLELKSEESSPDFGWLQQIQDAVLEVKNAAFIVAHSLGASMVLKLLSERPGFKNIKGLFLIATPFWSGDEVWKEGLKLKENFAEHLPDEISIFFYHCRDDEEVPFPQLGEYRQKLPKATFRELEEGGHQLNNNLSLVTQDIRISEGEHERLLHHMQSRAEHLTS